MSGLPSSSAGIHRPPSPPTLWEKIKRLLLRLLPETQPEQREPQKSQADRSWTVERLRERLEPWLRTVQEPAWTPMVSTEKEAQARSWYGGGAWLAPGAAWPECSGCKRPMRHWLTLDLAAIPADAGVAPRTGFLQFFYCASDDGSCSTWDHFSGAHRVQVIADSSDLALEQKAENPFDRVAIIDWKAHDDLPAYEDAIDLGLEYQQHSDAMTVVAGGLEAHSVPTDVVFELFSAEFGDKLGGWPAWIQGPRRAPCPRCQGEMKTVFQIDSDGIIPHSLGDGGCGHIMQCQEHPDVLTFGWDCT